MSKIYMMFGLPVRTGLQVGIEFELEGIATYHAEAFVTKVNSIEDNSLRNEGRELVTDPCTIAEAVVVHKTIFDNGVEFYPEFEVCSERCSTHVHVNFSDMEVDKVRQFIRLYALVEPLFFAAVNKSRQNNIYCVPLAATNLLYFSQTASVESLTNNWQKYCAFNVKRLADLGTIEFRHFEATEDTDKFEHWLRMIEGLYTYNKDNTIDLLLNTRQLSELVYCVTGEAKTLTEITTLLEDTLVNDLLLMVNPSPALLKSRLKEKKPAKVKAPTLDDAEIPF
jgi:hypothetical protein